MVNEKPSGKKKYAHTHTWTQAERKYPKIETVVSRSKMIFLNVLKIVSRFLHVNYWYAAMLFYSKPNNMKLPVFVDEKW